MSFLKKRKFLFKLIVFLCLSLAVLNFGMVNVTFAAHGPENHENEEPVIEENLFDKKYVFSDGCYYRVKGETNEKVWHIVDPETGETNTEYTEYNNNSSSFETLTGLAGILLQPIIQLCTSIGDGIMNIIHKAIMGTESEIIIDTRTGFWAAIGAVLAGLAVVVGIVALTVMTAGSNLPVFAAVVIGALGKATIPLAIGFSCIVYSGIDGSKMQEVNLLPLYTIGPEEIFKGNILLFDVNIFNPKEVYVKFKDNNGNIDTMPVQQFNAEEGTEAGMGRVIQNYFFYRDGNSENEDNSNIVITSTNDAAYELKETISKWYYTIRNIAIIGLMLVLIYVGIRILVSSTASEKAKYKEMIKDWVIGICLVFLLQYIMVFALNFTDTLTNLLSALAGEQHHVSVIKNADEKMIEIVSDDRFGENVLKGNDVHWYSNLMGRIRVLAQEESGSTAYIGYALCFLVLVLYTLIFTFTYLKRLLYLMFLTIIAPLVACTYPLDKLRDGKAQAFDIWIKEYTINLLIQPFHLLLYVVLISMAIDLSSTNIIYSLVALGFMIPAEKFLRKMFGFDRASTPGFLGGAAGAAVTMSAIHSLEKFAGRGPGADRKKALEGKQDDKNSFLNRKADSGHNNSTLFANVAAEKDDLKDDNNNKNKKAENEKNVPNPQDKKDLIDGEENSNELSEEDKKRLSLLENNVDEARQLSDDSDTTAYTDEEKDFAAANLAGAQAELDKFNVEHGLADLEDDDSNIDTSQEDTAGAPVEQISDKEKENREKSARRRRLLGYVGRRSLGTAGKTLRTGLKLTTGVTGGMIGAAAGIASGDPGSVVKNTTAGLYAGSAIGQGLGNSVSNFGKNTYNAGKAEREAIQQAKYGSDYSSYMKNAKDDEFFKNKEMRRKYMEDLKLDQIKDAKARKEAVDQAMNNAIKYRQEGVTDNDIIIRAMKSNKDGKYNADTSANATNIAAAKLAMLSTDQEKYGENMRRFASAPGMSQAKVKDMERRVRKITGL